MAMFLGSSHTFFVSSASLVFSELASLTAQNLFLSENVKKWRRTYTNSFLRKKKTVVFFSLHFALRNFVGFILSVSFS